MKTACIKYVLFLFGLALISCEEPFTPDMSDVEPKYVVEGYVEANDAEQATSAFVTIMRSIPFYGDVDRETINELYVHDAVVKISRGNETFQLPELCISDLPEEVRKEIIKDLEVSTFDSIDIEFCVYIDINNELQAAEGDELKLIIYVESDTLEAVTTLPYAVPIDSLKFKEPSGKGIENHKELIGYFSDPPEVANFYRYKVSVNKSRYQSGFISVVDDEIFNGQSFDFPLSNTTQFGEDFDPDVFGLYAVGDSVSIQWMSIDRAHYDFWSSLEYARTNQGPFSSYTRVRSNVKGALGVFGGFTTRYYDLRVPED